MPEESSIINILTYKLPFDLSRQIYNEYQDRLKEIKFITEKSKRYSILNDDIKTVELLLALSIFHKRVISNIDAATKFYNLVTKHGNAQSIKIGNYELDGKEKNLLLAVVLSYNKLIHEYGISPAILDYNLTKEFLDKILLLKDFDDAEI